MSELDPSDKALLQAYRRRESLAPAHRERLWEGVQAQLEPPRLLSGPWRAVAILVAALTLLVIGVEWSRYRAEQDTQDAVRDEALYGAKSRPAATAKASTAAMRAPREPPDSTPIAPPAPTADSSSPSDIPPSRSARAFADPIEGDPRSPSAAPAEPPALQTPSSNLEQESRLLHEARVALSRDKLERALTVLNEHRTRFEAGIFEPEREALLAIVRCRKREDIAPLTAFSARFPGSPLLERVRKGCTEPSGAGE